MKLCNILVSQLLFLFVFAPVSAQVKLIKKADNYFNDFNYKKAMKVYKEVEGNGNELCYVSCRVADCYRYLGDSEKAVDWYLKAKDYPDVDVSIYLILSQQLRRLEYYQEADKYLNRYCSLAGISPKKIEDSADLVDKLKNDSSNYHIYNLPINSRYSEIGPSIYKNSLVFSSNKVKASATKRSDVRDGNSFYKLYESKIKDLTTLEKPEGFSRNLSSKYNDGPVAFNQANSIAFITRNIQEIDSDKLSLNIFINVKKDRKWSRKSSAIPLSRNDCSFMHAFITTNDKRLYFVSDKEGGYGGLDIYYVDIEKGFLSSPVNLGPEVNSIGNEVFPFVSSDGELYYSSDKVGGLGGLDMFLSLPKGDGFTQSFNLGYPLNTSSDDFGLVWLQHGSSGYFVSNRKGGVGNDDIYAFGISEKYDYKYYYGTVISSEDSVPVTDVIVAIYNDLDLITTVKTDENGEFSFHIKSKDNLIIEVKKRFFDKFRAELDQISHSSSQGYKVAVVLNAY